MYLLMITYTCKQKQVKTVKSIKSESEYIMKKEQTTNNNLTDVSVVLKKVKFNTEKFTVIRKFDNEEFNDNTKERKSYANIRSNIDNRSIVKLWGHKDTIAVECSKMLRKRENIDVTTNIYTEKATDKNNNYICHTVDEAIAITNDFIKQVEKSVYTEKATATEKKATQKKAK